MAKSSIHHSHRLLKIGVVIILIILGLIVLKHLISKEKWYRYVVQSQKTVMQYKALDSIEDAGMIAATVVSTPPNAPILNNPQALQAYVEALSRQTGRDIVIVDNDEIILADTTPANVGKEYVEDKDDDVTKTIADGQARGFIEKGVDYPNGISQTVISFKNLKGAVVGAVIISNSKIF